MPQLTVKAIVTGVLLSIILSWANAYIGLFAGLTVSASIPAAVLSMAVLSLFKRSNILEHNIVQTAASAGESLAAGVIFTLPALLILNYWDVFDYWWVSVIAGVGGLLGVMYTIPLRHSLIVSENLAFPEGQATAQVLKAGQERGGEVRFLALGAGLGALLKLSETGLKLWDGIAQAATRVGESIAYAGSNLSPALVGVGYIVGINIASLVLLGGLFSWNVALPVFGAFYLENNPEFAAAVAGMSAAEAAFAIWSTQIRYLGVGAMITGGLWAIVSLRGSLVEAFRRGFGKSNVASAMAETDRDTPMRIVLSGVAVMAVFMWFIYYNVVGSAGISLAMTLLMVTTGFLFSAVAAYMAGLVGSSNNPVSGVTIATILFSSLLMLWLVGREDANAPAAVIMIGAVVCCAAAIGGDNMQDLKAGRIVGSTPYKQQVMQVVGVVSATFLLAPILNVLLTAYGIGPATSEQPDSLQAPQATLMASVAAGVLGDADLPWNMIATGAAVGVLIIVCDEVLKARQAGFRMPVLAVAVGIYLPVELAVPIFLGGLLSYLAKRARGGEAARSGSLLAAGLITGEALLGIFIAVVIVATGDKAPLALPFSAGSWLGMLALAAVAVLLYRAGARGNAAGSS